jgi:hypothetical protein
MIRRVFARGPWRHQSILQKHILKSISAPQQSSRRRPRTRIIRLQWRSPLLFHSGYKIPYSDRQPLSPDKLAPAGDSMESNTRKDALQATPSNEIHRGKSIGSRSAAAEAQFIYPHPLAWRWVNREWGSSHSRQTGKRSTRHATDASR